MSKKRVAILDGDLFAFQAACVSQAVTQWDTSPDSQMVTFDQSKAANVLSAKIRDMKFIVKPDTVVVAFTDREKPNWRTAVLPSYKLNRSSTPRPGGLRACAELLTALCADSFIRPGLEADDVMGIASTGGMKDSEVVIVTEDKDLWQIPGYIYNPRYPELGVQVVTTDEGDLFHACQALSGDTTDGYSGCPGVGKKGARKILEGLPKKEWWKTIVAKYESKGLSKEFALKMARVARIARLSDWDKQHQEIRLWDPTSLRR